MILSNCELRMGIREVDALAKKPDNGHRGEVIFIYITPIPRGLKHVYHSFFFCYSHAFGTPSSNLNGMLEAEGCGRLSVEFVALTEIFVVMQSYLEKKVRLPCSCVRVSIILKHHLYFLAFMPHPLATEPLLSYTT